MINWPQTVAHELSTPAVRQRRGGERGVRGARRRARLSLQYTMYGKFNGTSVNAADNNTLFLLLWLAG